MANRWKGNFIVATEATSSGTAYTGKANGAWSLNNQIQQKQAGLWAKGLTITNAPTNVSAVGLDTLANVSFTGPSDNGGSSSITYTVISSPGNITATGVSSPIQITGLTNGTSYTFTVTSTNASGTSSPSSPSSSVIPVSAPVYIGQPYGGGFYAGKINVSGTQYYLIVAPKASGEDLNNKAWGVQGTTTGITSVINGPTNSASLAALGASYQAAAFCEGLSIGGYTDWYLPAKNELEVLYYFLKPTTTANNISAGSNANAVLPEPISTNYTSGSPAQTSAGIGFRTGETDAFASGYNYWSSTDGDTSYAWMQAFLNGYQGYNSKGSANAVRAVRRIAV
jgi:hypothetical protein